MPLVDHTNRVYGGASQLDKPAEPVDRVNGAGPVNPVNDGGPVNPVNDGGPVDPVNDGESP